MVHVPSELVLDSLGYQLFPLPRGLYCRATLPLRLNPGSHRRGCSSLLMRASVEYVRLPIGIGYLVKR